MKISYNWLQTLIKVDLRPDKIAEILTDTGLEVEHVDTIETIKGSLEGLLVGHVVEKIKHPNADKLSVTKVDIGARELLQIVCGAPNVAEGQKVIIAPVGSTIYPLDHEPVKMKKAKIRGEVSEGMICAEDEVGLGSSHAGIMVLDESWEAGKPLSSYIEVDNDTVIEIGLTPNRGDAASHLGVARDLKAVLDRDIILPDVEQFKEKNKPSPVSVEVKDEESCPRYSGVCIDGVKVGPSPDWLRNRLTSIGINPINNIVDCTNYVMHELGQPIHAFDAAKISGKKIIVRQAKKKEKITTLDNVEREMQGDELLICDSKSPMAIAGVFGGLDSGVSDSTESIFLESAYFDPSSVRKTAKRHGLSTDASFRYERGVDPNISVFALRRVAHLITETAGGSACGQIIDHYPDPIGETLVNLEVDWINKFCGVDLSVERIEEILNRLDIVVVSIKDGKMKCLVPPYRSDVTRRVDLAEEILRIHGYNQVRFSQQLKYTMLHQGEDLSRKLRERASEYLTDRGFFEIMTNSQTNPAFFTEDELKTEVRMINPLSQEQAIMRPSMLATSLEAVAYNKNRRMSDILFYEFGQIYGRKEDNFFQNEILHLVTSGKRSQDHWSEKAGEANYYYLKGIVSGIIAKLGIPESKAAKHIEISEVKPANLKKHGIKGKVWQAWLQWEPLVNLAGKQKFNLREIPKFPEVKRDLAIVVEDKVSYQDLMKVIQSSAPKTLVNTKIFDVYKGKPLEENQKSYALSFTLSDPNKTLDDKDIDKSINKLMDRFEKELGATIRK